MAEYGTMINTNRVNLEKEIPIMAPFIIQLEVTGRCNLKCNFGPVNDRSVQNFMHRDDMTVELFDRFLQQCREFGQPIKVLRFIGNGEPFLNRNITTFVRKAKESECFNKIEITSNGTLLNEQLSRELVEAGLDTLKISLEAVDDATFYDIAGVHVDISKLRNELEFFYKNRSECKLYIKTTDVALNTEEQHQKFISEYESICDYFFVEKITDIWPEYSSNIGKKQRYNRTDVPSDPICIQPFDLLSITADGTVSPCCADWKRELVLGNIAEKSLLDMWEGEELKKLRIQLLKKERDLPCKVCGFPSVSQNDFIDDEAEHILERLLKS